MLATATAFDGFGRESTVTDNKGHVAKTVYDSANRVVYSIKNFDDFNPSTEANTGDATDTSKDRVTKFAYNDLSQRTQRIALDPDGDGSTSDAQATRYVYAFGLTDKGCTVPRSDLLRAVIYPDSDDTVSSSALSDGTDSTYDRVEHTYYANGAKKTTKDQRGTVRTFDYDDGLRLTADKVTTVGTGVDDAGLRIARAYDNRGRTTSVTSYDAATGGSVVNQVAYTQGAVYLLGKHYLAPGFRYEFTPLRQWHGQMLINLNDPSAYLNSVFEFSLAEDVYLDFGLLYGMGPSNSEFMLYPNVVYLAVKRYF